MFFNMLSWYASWLDRPVMLRMMVVGTVLAPDHTGLLNRSLLTCQQ
jgi:hypothetical protein